MRLERGSSPVADARFSIGSPAIDAVLGGGLVRGALHEVFAEGMAHEPAAAAFAIVLALRASGAKPIVWVRQDFVGLEMGEIYAPGLAELGLADRPLIAAGYSYGAGLAVVAAAEAERWGIPVPSAVFGVFPYFVRGHDRGPLVVPPTTTVTMLVGDRDQVVGERGAASIVRSITPHPAAVRMLESDDACTYGHLSALQSTPAAQSAFWSPLDRIVDRLAPA